MGRHVEISVRNLKNDYNHTFEEQYWLPAHNDRCESSLFRKHRKFIRDECGLKEMTCS